MLKIFEVHSTNDTQTLVNKCLAENEDAAEAFLRQIGRIPANHTVLMVFERQARS